ncbi:hypothetical protein RKLH11_2825 [Rhodobacteraceae bacterium KLH11]|nr:hypothetical protein RKLH11_2825 [Rhodobacteraceae bacterium KLH11]
MHEIKIEMMADPQLADLHHQACEWHRSKAEELKARPDWAELVEALQTSFTGEDAHG